VTAAGPTDEAGATVSFRSATPLDAAPIAAAIDAWWDRHLHHFVHHLLLEHIGDTCLVVERDGGMVGFLVGMLSQTRPDSAYVHFLGVRPDCRRLGLGSELYERFFALVRARGRTVVLAETGDFNRRSVLFHRSLGFDVVGGDDVVDGVAITRDYHGTGDDVVLLRKRLDAE